MDRMAMSLVIGCPCHDWGMAMSLLGDAITVERWPYPLLNGCPCYYALLRDGHVIAEIAITPIILANVIVIVVITMMLIIMIIPI